MDICQAVTGIRVGLAERPCQFMTNLSHTQIDRLGDRLREDSLTESDLRILDEYRRLFEEAYETVVRTLRDELHLEPTGRPAKSTSSLIEKLRRESIRLSQVQGSRSRHCGAREDRCVIMHRLRWGVCNRPSSRS